MQRSLVLSSLLFTLVVASFGAGVATEVRAVDDAPFVDEQPAPLPAQGSCGDNRCNPPEDCRSCPSDCGDCCGDRRCAPPEDCRSCPGDCGDCCGDHRCAPPEDCRSCPSDCC